MTEGTPIVDVERMYRSLYLIRRVEEEIIKVYWLDVVKSPVHLSIGQEGVSVGVCDALRSDDVVFGSYRGHALFLARGGDPRRMVAELYGKQAGVTKGKGGSMHLIDPDNGLLGTSAVVATTIPEAVGYALAQRQRGRDGIVVSFFGDGATEEGAFYESINFAALHHLPVLFVCENNFYAIHTRIERRQANPDIASRVRGFGVPAQRVDDDVIALSEIARTAIAEIRAGGGPRFLECQAYRWMEHVGPGEDFHVGYRSRAEAEPWMDRDPVNRTALLLATEVRARVEAEVEATVADAFEYASNAPFPSLDELWTDVYAP